MEIIIGILLILSFFGLAYYAIKGGNLFMGILIIATIWLVLPLIGNFCVRQGWVFDKSFYETNKELVDKSFKDALDLVYQKGPESWGATLVNVVFGAGAVVAIGVIILPILISLGIPKKCAIVSYTLSIGAGMFINPVLNSQYSGFFPGWTINDNLAWGFTMMGIQVLFTLCVVIFFTRKKRISQAWAAEAPQRKKLDFAPTPALIAPILPVVLNLLGAPIILGFIIAGFYALAVCGKLKSFKGACRILNKDFFDGVVDAAPLVGFLLVLPMFNKAATLCSPYFNAVLGSIIPKNSLVLIIIFACLAPLGLFRGPFTLFGCGAALLGILMGFGTLPVEFLAALFIIPSTVMNVSCCITQSWIAWGIGYTKVPTKEYLKTSIICGWSLCVIMELVTYFCFYR